MTFIVLSIIFNKAFPRAQGLTQERLDILSAISLPNQSLVEILFII